jgi:thiol:disulfide interchange protein
MLALMVKQLHADLSAPNIDVKMLIGSATLFIMSLSTPGEVLGGVLDDLPAPSSRASNPVSSRGVSPTPPLQSAPVQKGGFPSVDEAFQVVWSFDGKAVRGEFTIAPGCYLYQDRFKILLQSIRPTASAQAGQPLERVLLGALAMPEGEKVEDPFLGGTHTIYRSSVTISAPLNLDESDPWPAPTQIKIEAIWQGCAEAGLCYPAVRKTFQLTSTPH